MINVFDDFILIKHSNIYKCVEISYAVLHKHEVFISQFLNPYKKEKVFVVAFVYFFGKHFIKYV